LVAENKVRKLVNIYVRIKVHDADTLEKYRSAYFFPEFSHLIFGQKDLFPRAQLSAEKIGEESMPVGHVTCQSPQLTPAPAETRAVVLLER